MRTTITKTVSMMLVTVMVLGVAVMPMRANAAFEISQHFGTNPTTLTLDIINLVIQMGIEMTSGANQGEPLPSTIAAIAAYWEPYVTSSVVILTQQQMAELVQGLKKQGITCELYRRNDFPAEYMCIRIVSTNIAGYDFSSDISFGSFYTFDGRTVVCKVDSNSASQTPTNKYTDDDGQQDTVLVIDPETQKLIEVTVNNAVTNAMNNYLATINVTNNTAYSPTTNTYNNYTDMSYNPTNQTYTVNFSDNRSYTYQFYYEYTYITYIGSSAEYREAYKVYYELPDGRSSGDLTIDELKGLSLQFDMVNYDKAASDTMTQVLLPFDGDVSNDSYFDWDYRWNAGASTEYLESPEPFGGSLYHPSTPFSIDYFTDDPFSSLSWTAQFRFYLYQSESSAFCFCVEGQPFVFAYSQPSDGYNQQDKYFLPVYASNTLTVPLFYVLGSTGNYYFGFEQRGYSGSDSLSLSYNVAGNLAFGNWYDITITFEAGNPVTFDAPVYSLYINGVKVSSVPVPAFDDIWRSSQGMYLHRYLPGIVDSFRSVKLVDCGTWRWMNNNSVVSTFSSVQSSRDQYHIDYLGDYLPTLPGFYSISGFRFCSPNSSTGCEWQLDNFRLVSAALYNGADSFTPTPVPFDTNLVYVLPSVADLNDNTVAIMSQLPVSGYRVGGIRPTDPTLATGYIYMHIDGDFVDSVQQWNGAYWEEVTARLYTGIRWIPVTAFNVFTLEDMFDIIDPDADGSGPGFDSIYQYYLWWSGEWGTFQDWLKGTLQTLIDAIQNSGGGGSTDAPVIILPGVNDSTTTNEITTQNPDGSTTVTTIVSNAAGLVYSRSVTTWPANAEGVTHSREIYTDSTGVMYSTEWDTDAEGNTTITTPEQATGTLGAIMKMITQGMLTIAGSVIEAFTSIVVEGVHFIIDSAGTLIDGIGDMLGAVVSSLTDFTGSVEETITDSTVAPADGEETYGFLDLFLQVFPPEITAALTLCFVCMVVFPLLNKMHF